MGEIDTKPMIKSFICLFLFQIEDFVFKWLRNRFQVLLTTESDVQSMTDDELVAYVDFEVSEYARRMTTHVYDDEQAFQAQKEAFPRATAAAACSTTTTTTCSPFCASLASFSPTAPSPCAAPPPSRASPHSCSSTRRCWSAC